MVVAVLLLVVSGVALGWLASLVLQIEDTYGIISNLAVGVIGAVTGGMVIFRWMQNLIDLCTEAPAPPEPALTQEPTPFDEPAPVQTSLSGGQMYPGEDLADYAPRASQAAAPAGPAAGTPEADALIDDDADDLPF